MDLTDAIKTISAAGGVFLVPPGKHLSLREAASQLDFSVKWLREHLHEFPNAWRAPGGELRIPQRDVDALATKNKLRREV